MANTTGDAPSMGSKARQTARGVLAAMAVRRWDSRLETALEAERDQLPLWLPVAFGAGIAAWFALPHRDDWIAVMIAALAVAGLGLAVDHRRRTGKAMLLAALAVAAGCGWIWLAADSAAAPVLERAAVTRFQADVQSVQRLPARDTVRVLLRPVNMPGLPPLVRVNIADRDVPAGLVAGDRLSLRVRLMPPPPPAVPGAYDFARIAWFQGIGATGRAFAPVERIGGDGDARPGLRERLSAHIQSRLDGGAAGIATALATGDQGAVPEEDAEAMRRSGLAHLLSVSGLHITAVVGAAMLLVMRLLALSPALALRWPLLLVAAGAGALAGIGYTLLTGAEVPTIRSCIAALLVLAGLALGREAITLRLVATGALVVLIFWPEALVGASFQLSFAAVTAIVALHEHPRVRALLSRRDEGWAARIGRLMLGLLLTGLAVEIALTPIVLFHFHKAGLYGALANIIAIPLTTFVVMPLEALALLFDVVGLGAPFWWATGVTLNLLLFVAHGVADAPGSVAMLASMPRGAFALMVAGGLWICLWRTRLRRWGAVPLAIGAVWAVATPAPDILITGDGQHLAVRGDDGRAALLRPRAGDYVRDMLAESSGIDGELAELEASPGARCSPDMCVVDLRRGDRVWRLMATRSGYLMPIGAFTRACREADIVVSDRRVPRTCTPRWLKADRLLLAQSGGLAIRLSPPSVDTVVAPASDHPWVRPPTVMPPRDQ
jgi:competence protein ComEC